MTIVSSFGGNVVGSVAMTGRHMPLQRKTALTPIYIYMYIYIKAPIPGSVHSAGLSNTSEKRSTHSSISGYSSVVNMTWAALLQKNENPLQHIGIEITVVELRIGPGLIAGTCCSA